MRSRSLLFVALATAGIAFGSSLAIAQVPTPAPAALTTCKRSAAGTSAIDTGREKGMAHADMRA